jgi:hypothetical protein
MPRTRTCGSPARATEFDYDGSVAQGITLRFDAGDVQVTPQFLNAIRANFAGQRIAGGFKMDDPRPNGFGEWVRDNSPALNGRQLTPRHASFIAAVLRDAGWLQCQLVGNAVYLQFAP